MPAGEMQNYLSVEKILGKWTVSASLLPKNLLKLPVYEISVFQVVFTIITRKVLVF